MTVRECIAAFGFSSQSWHAARQRGDLVTRERGLPLDELLSTQPRNRSNIKRRLLEAGLKEPRCERCRRSRWEGAAIPLDLHHENGDRHDNRLENLRLLCPNCHVLADRATRRRGAAGGGSARASVSIHRTGTPWPSDQVAASAARSVFVPVG